MSTNMERWFTELETTDAGQAVAALHQENENGDEAFCCLGIGCELAVKDGVVKAVDFDDKRLYEGQGSLPPLSFATWLGVTPTEGHYSSSFDLHLLDRDGSPLRSRTGDVISAAYMNDDCGLSFKQIAQMLRTHDLRIAM